VPPHLEFATPVWSPWQAADKEKLASVPVQRKMAKMVFGLNSKDYEERCKELGLEMLEKRRGDMDIIQIYKIMNGRDKLDPSKKI